MPALDPPAKPAAAAPGPSGAAAAAPAGPPPKVIWEKVSTRRALLQDSLSTTPSLGALTAAPAKTAAHSPAPAHAPPAQDPKLVFVFNTPGARRHLLHSTAQVSSHHAHASACHSSSSICIMLASHAMRHVATNPPAQGYRPVTSACNLTTTFEAFLTSLIFGVVQSRRCRHFLNGFCISILCL